MLRMPNEDPSLSKDFRPLGSPLPRPQPTAAPKDKYEKTGTPGVVKNTETGKLETMIPTPSKMQKPQIGPIPAKFLAPGEVRPIDFKQLPEKVQQVFIDSAHTLIQASWKTGKDHIRIVVEEPEGTATYYMALKDDSWTYKFTKKEPKSYPWAPTQVVFDDIQPESRRKQEFRKFQEYLRKDMELAMFQARTKTRYVVDPAKLTAEEKIDWQNWFRAADILDKNLFNEEFLQRPDQVFLTKEARMNAIQKLTPFKDTPLSDMMNKTNPI